MPSLASYDVSFVHATSWPFTNTERFVRVLHAFIVAARWYQRPEYTRRTACEVSGQYRGLSPHGLGSELIGLLPRSQGVLMEHHFWPKDSTTGRLRKRIATTTAVAITTRIILVDSGSPAKLRLTNQRLIPPTEKRTKYSSGPAVRPRGMGAPMRARTMNRKTKALCRRSDPRLRPTPEVKPQLAPLRIPIHPDPRESSR